MEYDAEESDNGSDMPAKGWPGPSRHETTPNDPGNIAIEDIHGLCIFDAISVPIAAQPSSPLVEVLAQLPVRQRWGRWRWREQPTLSNVRVAQAVMIYERGLEQPARQRCRRCRAGQGISPHCVVGPPEIRHDGKQTPCSNCVYDGAEPTCNAAGRKPSLVGPRRSSFEDPEKMIDHLAVLGLITRVEQTPGVRRDASMASRARRIEAAALQIAKAAREWGEKVAE